MILNYHSSKAASITARLIAQHHRDNLPPISVELSPTDYFYLERDEAYTLLSALESAIHDYEQDICEHPATELAHDEQTRCRICGILIEDH